MAGSANIIILNDNVTCLHRHPIPLEYLQRLSSRPCWVVPILVPRHVSWNYIGILLRRSHDVEPFSECASACAFPATTEPPLCRRLSVHLQPRALRWQHSIFVLILELPESSIKESTSCLSRLISVAMLVRAEPNELLLSRRRSSGAFAFREDDSRLAKVESVDKGDARTTSTFSRS
jgi:hypothetical protein